MLPWCHPLELAHYCRPTLGKGNIDAIIIHVGTNCLASDDPDTIAKDVQEIVKVCKEYGINDIFVSGITYREYFENEILNFNNFLMSSQSYHNFTFISNENIIISDLWKDRIHLNENGLSKIANNFIKAMKRRFPA